MVLWNFTHNFEPIHRHEVLQVWRIIVSYIVMTSWDLTGRVTGVWLYLYREMFVCLFCVQVLTDVTDQWWDPWNIRKLFKTGWQNSICCSNVQFTTQLANYRETVLSLWWEFLYRKDIFILICDDIGPLVESVSIIACDMQLILQITFDILLTLQKKIYDLFPCVGKDKKFHPLCWCEISFLRCGTSPFGNMILGYHCAGCLIESAG